MTKAIHDSILDKNILDFQSARDEAIVKMLSPLKNKKRYKRDSINLEDRLWEQLEAENKAEEFKKKLSRGEEVLSQLRNDIRLQGEELRMADQWKKEFESKKKMKRPQPVAIRKRISEYATQKSVEQENKRDIPEE